METKNICGKIPIELHEKVRQELEGTEMTIPQFLTQVIREHFVLRNILFDAVICRIPQIKSWCSRASLCSA